MFKKLFCVGKHIFYLYYINILILAVRQLFLHIFFPAFCLFDDKCIKRKMYVLLFK